MKPKSAKSGMLAILAVIGVLAATPRKTAAQDFSYKAREDRVIGHRDGELALSDRGVEFKTKSGTGSLTLAYQDIKLFEIMSPTKVRIWTYEGRTFPPRASVDITFHIVGGEISSDVSDFVRARIARPVVSELIKEGGQPEAQIAVEHLHRIGGCAGVLKVYPGSLVFEVGKGSDSRGWRWTDIRSISKLGPYRLEVLTYEPQAGGPTRSYNFELKQPLPERIYESIWERVFRPALPAKRSEADGEHDR
ncbi:MAG TPA: hypothetical protein VJX67_09290 [Blastocatellia bacterium]|nr:hypothetical protein [Blastocatellia bacterium]